MATPPAHGYSGKPLFQKIGVKPGMRIGVVMAPPHYAELMAGAPSGVEFQHARAAADLGVGADIVHVFCADAAALEASSALALQAIGAGGMLWVSWPKKSSKLFKDLTEDGVRAAVLPAGWVDVKVCAVDADWSGLKFLKRKASS